MSLSSRFSTGRFAAGTIQATQSRSSAASGPSLNAFLGRPRRAGATMVETVLILNVFLLLIVGTLDLGLATYRYNTLSQAARQGARQAIVHGALAKAPMAVWGPGTYNGTAADGSEFALAIRPMLAGFKLSDVAVRVEWIDGGNNVQQRVRFNVSTDYRPIVAFFSSAAYTLRASSTMPIAH